MKFPNSKILIFAKTPKIGFVKKRLIPLLGPEGALDFYKKCIKYTLVERCISDLASVLIYVTSDGDLNFFPKILQDFPVSMHYQKGKDLGERMYNATKKELKNTDSIILIGTDAPALNNQDIEEAFIKLENKDDIVMKPAEDGGYVLLGMKKTHKSLFVNIPWGTDSVAEISRQRCKEKNINLIELKESWDIDRPEDLKKAFKLESFNRFINQASF